MALLVVKADFHRKRKLKFIKLAFSEEACCVCSVIFQHSKAGMSGRVNGEPCNVANICISTKIYRVPCLGGHIVN